MMSKHKITEVISLSREYSIVPTQYEEKVDLLKNFGITQLSTFYQAIKQIQMVYLNDVLIYPWTVSVRYCDPIWQVAHVELYIHPLELYLDYWMCVNTIREAGNNPLYNEENHIVQDMAWLCEDQSDSVYNSTFLDPVLDWNNKIIYPELSAHVQYLFDVIYGIKGYPDSTGKLHYVATSQKWAQKWKEACINDGYKKYGKIIQTKRYLDYINNINTLIGKSVETKEKVLAEKVHTDTNLITKLTARL